MDQKISEDPEKARYLRKKHHADGVDEEEEQEEIAFMENPMEAINKSSKQRTEKSLEGQIEYFGHAMEPFHMREEEELGEVDGEGYFVFARRRKVRDPWLESIEENEEPEIADKIVKRIKTESRFKSVYEANDKLNEDIREEDSEDDQQSEKSEGEDEEEDEKEKEEKIKKLIKEIIELIPSGISPNKHLKELKKNKKTSEYKTLLSLCNNHISMTGEHDVMTKKKEELEEVLEGDGKSEESAELNWDEEKSEKSEEEDDIFWFYISMDLDLGFEFQQQLKMDKM